MLKRYKAWLNYMAKQKKMRKGNKEYLVNLFADIPMLQDLIDKTVKERISVDIWTVDGTHLRLSPKQDNIIKTSKKDEDPLYK